VAADPTTFGVKLKEFREAAGLNQSELAELVGTSSQTVSRLESGGISDPVWSLAVKIARALGRKLDEFAPVANEKGRGKPK
jgi:transcriptional regulator with XRE-family HTH domain